MATNDPKMDAAIKLLEKVLAYLTVDSTATLNDVDVENVDVTKLMADLDRDTDNLIKDIREFFKTVGHTPVDPNKSKPS